MSQPLRTWTMTGLKASSMRYPGRGLALQPTAHDDLVALVHRVAHAVARAVDDLGGVDDLVGRVAQGRGTSSTRGCTSRMSVESPALGLVVMARLDGDDVGPS